MMRELTMCMAGGAAGGWLMVSAAALLAVSGCDLGADRNRADPSILSVSAKGAGSQDGTLVGTDWVLDLPGNYYEPAGYSGSLYPVIFVRTNQLLDGASIQTAPSTQDAPNGDCTPANGWLTATPAVTGTDKWYSCYLPTSVPGGGSVVLFKAAEPIAASLLSKWGLLATLEVPEAGPAAKYTFSGTVKDQNGRSLPISVIANVLPPPGQPGAPSLSSPVVSADKYDITINWVAPGGGLPTPPDGYLVQRADSVANPTSSSWVDIDPSANADAVSYKIAAEDPNTSHWYRVVATNSGGRGRPTTKLSAIGQPGGTTYSSGSAPSATSYGVTISWIEPTSSVIPVAQYLLQRAPDGGGAPAPADTTFNGWMTVCTVNPGITSCPDTGLDPAKAYWYQVVARADLGGGVTPVSPANQASSAVPQPSWGDTPLAYDAATNTVTVSWKAPVTTGTLGVTSYRVERAPDATGKPGSWVTIAGGLSAATTSYADNTVTARLRYWYRVSALNAVGPANVLGPPTAYEGIVTR